MINRKAILLVSILFFSITFASAISWSGGGEAVFLNPFDQVLNTTSNVSFGNVTSSSWFNGLFNWIINLGDSSPAYLTFNGSTLSFNETKLNATILNLSGGGGGGGGGGLWESNGTTIFNITTSQVGIRTPTPSHTLTVNGTINVTDSINEIAMYFENTYLVVEG